MSDPRRPKPSTRPRRLEDLSIPTLPRLFQHYLSVLERPEAELEELAELAEGDPPFAAHVLRLANSAVHGQRSPVTDLRRASVVVGARTLRSLILKSCVHRMYDHLVRRGYDLEVIWRHSSLVAAACREIALRIREPNCRVRIEPNNFFTVGLLHDIGRVALLDNLGDEYLEILGGKLDGGDDAVERERLALGYDHGAAGARVLAAWGLPEVLHEPIERQHAPRLEGARDVHAAILRCADDLVAHEQQGRPLRSHGLMPRLYLNLLRIDEKSLVQVQETIRRECQRDPGDAA